MHCSQSRADQRSQGNIVKAGHGNLFRHTLPQLGARLQDPDGDQIVIARDRRHLWRLPQKLPRSLLEDLAILRGPGRNLVKVLDADNPRWKKSPSRDEERRAKRSYLSWLARSN